MHVEFGEDGRLTGEDMCGGFEATWALSDGMLDVSDFTLLGTSCDAQLLLAPVLERSPAVGRFDDDPGSLRCNGTGRVVRSRATIALAEQPRVRVDGLFLWLSGPSGVVYLSAVTS